MPLATEIQIHPMHPAEKPRIAAIMRRAFPLTQQLFFSWKGHTLVAERAGELLGATVLDTFSLPGGRRGGIVLWIFTDPAVHGQGAGQALAEGAIEFFEAAGCTDMFACIEGYNTSSEQLFATRGFGILSPGAQWQRYGWGTPALWWRTFHFIDIGHFLWTRPPDAKLDNPPLQWLGVLLFNTLLIGLSLWRQHRFRPFPLLPLLLGGLALLVFFGARTLAMWGAARAQGLTLRYRAWESGFPLGVLIAGILGGLYLNPGGFYPTVKRWRYREWLPQLGPVALAGVCSTLLLNWVLWGLRHWGAAGAAQSWREIAQWVGGALGMLDVVTAFFPFISYNGRRLWDWKPWLWGVCALATVALFLW